MSRAAQRLCAQILLHLLSLLFILRGMVFLWHIYWILNKAQYLLNPLVNVWWTVLLLTVCIRAWKSQNVISCFILLTVKDSNSWQSVLQAAIHHSALLSHPETLQSTNSKAHGKLHLYLYTDKWCIVLADYKTAFRRITSQGTKTTFTISLFCQ